MMFNRITLALILVLFLPRAASLAPVVSASDGPTITVLSTNLTDYPDGKVPLYNKFEVTFTLSDSYTNPFDPGQIQVDGTFTSPGQVISTQPGFYYQDYQVSTTAAGLETYSPTGIPVWKVRFTPDQTGVYQYTLSAADQDGTSTTGTFTFEVVSSSLPGFVKVSMQNPRYFEFDNGEPFLGFGVNVSWWGNEQRRISTYEAYLSRMGASKANLARVWMTNSGRQQDWILSIQDQALGSAYNLEEAWAFDRIVDLARQNGVYFLLTLDDVNQYTYNWPDNLYNSDLGGPCSYRSAIFTDPQARQLQQRIFRYIIARWGYSPNILSWEFFNEIDELQWSDQNNWDRQAMIDWHTHMAGYVKSIDAHNHLVNTSTGSFKTHLDLYGPPALDLTEIHFYYVEGCCSYAPSDPAGRDMADLTRYYAHRVYSSVDGKPALIGEWGLLNDSWLDSPFLDDDNAGVHLHNGLWSALMSGMASTGLSWHWSHHLANDPSWWRHYLALANYFEDIYLPGLMVMKPLHVDFSLPGGSDDRPEAFGSTNENLRVMGLRSGNRVYAWVQNKTNTWWNTTHGIEIPQQSGTISIYDLEPATQYLLEIWNTYSTTQQVVSRTLLTTHPDGSLQHDISSLESDLAVKVFPIMAHQLWLPSIAR